MPFPPTAYQMKRVALYPRLAVMRNRERHQSQFVRQALDVSNYSRNIYRFIGARMEDPDILHDIALADDEVALDVGGYVGSWCTAVAERSGSATIHSFEVSPRVVPALKKAVAGDPRIVVQEYGLGGQDRTVLISRRGLGSSVYKHDASLGADEGTIRDIVDVWSELRLDRVRAMKINIEGGEYELLDRMAQAGLLAQVDTYLIQFHEWIRGSHRRRRRIHRHLAESHELRWCYPFIWERWERRPAGVSPRQRSPAPGAP